MVDVNSEFCNAVEDPRNKEVCQTLERLKGIDVLEVPIVLAEVHGMKVVAEDAMIGKDNVNVYSNAEFNEKFDGEKVVTFDEYKDARDYVSDNRSNPQMTSIGLSQMSYMDQRIDHLEETYMREGADPAQPEVSPIELTH